MVKSSERTVHKLLHKLEECLDKANRVLREFSFNSAALSVQQLFAYTDTLFEFMQ